MRAFYILYTFTFYMKIMYMVDLMHIPSGTKNASDACYDTSMHKMRTFQLKLSTKF